MRQRGSRVVLAPATGQCGKVHPSAGQRRPSRGRDRLDLGRRSWRRRSERSRIPVPNRRASVLARHRIPAARHSTGAWARSGQPGEPNSSSGHANPGWGWAAGSPRGSRNPGASITIAQRCGPRNTPVGRQLLVIKVRRGSCRRESADRGLRATPAPPVALHTQNGRRPVERRTRWTMAGTAARIRRRRLGGIHSPTRPAGSRSRSGPVPVAR